MRTSLALLLALLVPSVAAAAPDCKSLVVTGHPSYPPVAWASKGALVGAAPDLVRAVAATAGVTKVTSKDFGSWEKAQAAAKGGKADVIFGIYKNDARLAWLDYVEPPFMVDPVSVVVRAGAAFPYSQWSDLEGKKGVTNVGESYGDAFDAFLSKKLTVARAPGVEKVFAALLDGSADYAIIALYPGRNVARQLGVAAKVEFLPTPIVSADMYVAFSKKSKCGPKFRAAFADALAADVKAGKVKALVEAAEGAFARP